MSDQKPQAIRAFLDANVLYAAALSPEGGASKLWGLANVELVTSEQALKEAWVNLGTDRGRTKADAAVTRSRLTTLMAAVEVVASDADRSSHMFCPWRLKDPDDVPILMDAVKCSCQYLLTSDFECFGEFFGRETLGVKVLPPGRFLAELGKPDDRRRG